MRVTAQMQNNMIQTSLRNALEELSNKNNQLFSGKKISKPSDDVIAAVRAMDYKVSISDNDRYRGNIDLAKAELPFTGTIIEAVSNGISEVKSMLALGSGKLEPEQKATNSLQAAQWRDMFLDLSSNKYGNKYIFSGYKTTTPSFTYNAATFQYDYNGDNGVINVPVDKGATMPLNIQGSRAFSPTLPATLPAALEDGTAITYAQATNPVNGVNTLTITIGAVGDPGYDSFTVSNYMDMANVLSFAYKDQDVDGTALDAVDPAMSESMGIRRIEALSPVFDSASSQIFQVTSDLSQRQLRLSDESDRLTAMKLNLTNALSKVEDVDLNEVAIDIKSAEIALDAMRATAAKVLSQSLFDFLQ